jgi:hypothetical protein
METFEVVRISILVFDTPNKELMIISSYRADSDQISNFIAYMIEWPAQEARTRSNSNRTLFFD